MALTQPIGHDPQQRARQMIEAAFEAMARADDLIAEATRIDPKALQNAVAEIFGSRDSEPQMLASILSRQDQIF